VASEADAAAVASTAPALAGAAADPDALALAAAADAAATLAGEPHATTPAISTAEPANSARTPIVHPLPFHVSIGPV
jgi:hypothetical protein